MASVTPISTKKPSKMPDFSEIGRTGIKRFSGQLYEEFLTSLQGKRGIAVFREMKDNDAVIGACLYAIKQVIREVSWFVRPSGNSAEEKKAAEYLKECMGDCSHSWNDFISDVLSFLPFGWSWHEIVYKLRKGDVRDPKRHSKYTDGGVGWRKLSIRKQTTLHSWVFDEEGGIDAMIQSPPPDFGQLIIPIEKSLLFRTESDGNNPEGRSLLRNVYRAYYYKKNLETIEAIGIERDLVGLPIVEPPEGFEIDSTENVAVNTYVNKLLANIRRDEQEGIYLPPGWKISLLSMGRSTRQFDVDKVINRWDKRIAMSLLAQFVMLGMDRVGSFALSKTSNDLFNVATQSILDVIAETLNSFAVPRLFKFNPNFVGVGGDKHPIFVPGKVATPPLKDLADYITSLGQNNLLPIDDEEFRNEVLRLGRFREFRERKFGELQGNIENRKPEQQPLPISNLEEEEDGED
jgi:hypothetical protein